MSVPSAESIETVAKAIEAKRIELIASPIGRIYRQLAAAAIAAYEGSFQTEATSLPEVDDGYNWARRRSPPLPTGSEEKDVG